MSDHWQEERLNSQKEYVASNIVQICVKKIWLNTLKIHCDQANSTNLVKWFTIGTFRPRKTYFGLEIKGDRMNVMDLDGRQLDSMVVDNTLVPHWDYMSSYRKEAYQEMQPVIDMITKWFNHFHSPELGRAADSALVWHAISKIADLVENHVK